MSLTWFADEELPFSELRPGTLARSLSVPGIQVLFITYEDATVAPTHEHDHLSLIYVTAGEVEMVVDGETRLLTPGGGVVVAANEPHALTTEGPARILELWFPVAGG